MSSKYLDQIIAFRETLMPSTHELMDELFNGKGYDERFDLKIEFNGKKVAIPMNADVFCIFEEFIDSCVEDAKQ